MFILDKKKHLLGEMRSLSFIHYAPPVLFVCNLWSPLPGFLFFIYLFFAAAVQLQRARGLEEEEAGFRSSPTLVTVQWVRLGGAGRSVGEERLGRRRGQGEANFPGCRVTGESRERGLRRRDSAGLIINHSSGEFSRHEESSWGPPPRYHSPLPLFVQSALLPLTCFSSARYILALLHMQAINLSYDHFLSSFGDGARCMESIYRRPILGCLTVDWYQVCICASGIN